MEYLNSVKLCSKSPFSCISAVKNSTNEIKQAISEQNQVTFKGFCVPFSKELYFSFMYKGNKYTVIKILSNVYTSNVFSYPFGGKFLTNYPIVIEFLKATSDTFILKHYEGSDDVVFLGNISGTSSSA